MAEPLSIMAVAILERLRFKAAIRLATVAGDDRATQQGDCVVMDVATVLNAAADLIEPEGAWAQGAFAADDFGSKWQEYEPAMYGAVCWCAIGAVAEVTGENPWETWEASPAGAAMDAIKQVIGGPVALWNDAPDRTQAEVVTALRQAAQRAKEAGHGG